MQPLTESDKYAICYRDPVYRMGRARLDRAQQDIASLPAASTFLDVGCGRGELLEFARANGIQASGLELVPALCGDGVVQGEITAIPFDDDWFGFVGCYDVVEHLPEASIDQALDELFRVAAHEVFLSTNDKRSMYHGMELHLTRKPRQWWEQKLRARSSYIIGSTFGLNDWHWRCRVLA